MGPHDGVSYYSFCPTPEFRYATASEAAPGLVVPSPLPLPVSPPPRPALPRVVVLDGYDVSRLGWPEDHPLHKQAEAILAAQNPNEVRICRVIPRRGEGARLLLASWPPHSLAATVHVLSCNK